MTGDRSSPPRVSVVMPVRDAVTTVARAAESILAQTFASLELVAVDDGSVDGTRAQLDAMAARDARVRVVAQPPLGIVTALNRGLAEARAPLVARMDADDECHPERLADQVALLDARPDVGMVGCLAGFGGDRAVSGGYSRFVEWQNELVHAADIARERFVESPFAHPSVVFRRVLVDLHGGYRDGPFPEDYELWLRWLDAGVTMTKVPRVRLTWHDPPTRLSRTDPRYDPEAFYRVKAEWLARHLARSVAPDRRILVWGAGRPTRRRARYLTAHGTRLSGWVDIDPAKQGRELYGLPVLSPGQLPPAPEAFVLGYVASWGARAHIRSELAARGYREGPDFLMAA